MRLILSVRNSFVSSPWKYHRLDSSEIHAHSRSRTRFIKSFASSEGWPTRSLAANSIGTLVPGRGRFGLVALNRSKFWRSSSSAPSLELAHPDIPGQLITLAVHGSGLSRAAGGWNEMRIG